ncbi:MAG: hypothetical protein WCK65_11350 [Rhodospirillaceae bacterium]
MPNNSFIVDRIQHINLVRKLSWKPKIVGVEESTVSSTAGPYSSVSGC